jgi:sortase A
MADREVDATQRWEGVPELGGPVRRRPPVPGTQPAPVAEVARDDEPTWDDRTPEDQFGSDGEPRPARRRDPFWQLVARGVGELLVTAGLVLLLFVVYEVYVTDWVNGQQQEELSDQIHEEWEATAPSAAPGSPMTVAPAEGELLAVLHIPRLGEDWQRVVLEGTAEDELTKGPGHYVGTALPGQVGNVGLAGHRVGKGSPFLDADQLVPGDAIVVETADSWFVYRVLGDEATGDYTTDPSGIPGQQIVRPTDVGVIAPVPGAVGATPTASYLTLTTCHPKYSARQRLIVHAVLEGAGISKADAPDGPPELQEG